MNNPVKILGAGISGLTTAITLVRNGIQVIVYERESDVGMRFHNDIQGLENGTEKTDILQELQSYNIPIDFDTAPLHDLTIANGKREYAIHFKKPLHYMVKRGPSPGTVDYSLKNHALSVGVNIRFDSTIETEHVDIIATGPIPSKTTAVAKGMVFKTDIKQLASGIYNDRMAFKGYSYLLISEGHGCMATVVYNDFARVNECFERTKAHFVDKYNLKITETRPMVGIGCFSTCPVFEKNNQMFVGEAAGLQDFVAGFGMRYAFQSGYLAACSIINGESYQAVGSKKFLPMVKSCIVNRWLWETVLNRNNYSLMLIIYKLMANANNGDSFHFNHWQTLVFPFAQRYIKKMYPRV